MKSEPRCPQCGWKLAFRHLDEHDHVLGQIHEWEAYCWNGPVAGRSGCPQFDQPVGPRGAHWVGEPNVRRA